MSRIDIGRAVYVGWTPLHHCRRAKHARCRTGTVCAGPFQPGCTVVHADGTGSVMSSRDRSWKVLLNSDDARGLAAAEVVAIESLLYPIDGADAAPERATGRAHGMRSPVHHQQE